MKLTSQGALHRGKNVVVHYLDTEPRCWTNKNGIDVILAEIDGTYWIVANEYGDDEKMVDDGPFPSLEVAVVAVNLS